MSERVIRLRVSGRVQGVGFRYFVRDRASRLGVRGWVRNLDDGSVELAAAGERSAVERLEAAVRAGPVGSRVDEVHVLPDEPGDELPAHFTILH